MPELGPSNDFIKKFNSFKKTHRPDLLETIPEKARVFTDSAKEAAQEVVGSGREVFVVNHPDSNQVIIALNYENLTPRMAKDIYYSQKIAQVLFPDHFPGIYMASASNNDHSIHGTVREKVSGISYGGDGRGFHEIMVEQKNKRREAGKAAHNMNKKAWWQGLFQGEVKKENRNEYSLLQLRRELQTLAKDPYYFPLIDSFDMINPANFIRGENGNDYYVDTLKLGKSLFQNNSSDENSFAKGVVRYMQDRHYAQNKIASVERYINRLRDLYRETY